jgi:hypothetical protein
LLVRILSTQCRIKDRKDKTGRQAEYADRSDVTSSLASYTSGQSTSRKKQAGHTDRQYGQRLDRSTALYIYKAKNCNLLVLFNHAQKTKFIFK